MTAEPMQVVLEIFPPELRAGEMDMFDLIDDEQFWARIGELNDPDAEVRFLTPDAGLIGGMGGPFRGPAGFEAGWREWLQPFDRFRIETGETRTAPDGRVVLLATTFGTLQGSTVEVPQPAAVVYAVRDGRITKADHYLEHDQALRDAGLAY
jgi:ketosteroid isomerase-like protein